MCTRLIRFNEYRILSLIFFVLLLALPSISARADNPSVHFWSFEGPRINISKDTIDATTALYGIRCVGAGGSVTGGSVSGLATTFTLPGGLWEYSANSAYADWDGTSEELRLSAIDVVNAGEDFSISAELPSTPTQITPKVGLTREISNEVFTQDVESRTVTVTLDVQAGALTGYDVIHVQRGPDNEAISATVTGATFPEEFWELSGFGPGYYACTNPAALSGTYEFSMNVEFTRNGQWTQAQMGDLYYKPGIDVSYGNQTGWVASSGTLVNQDLGSGLGVAVSTANVVDFSSQALTNFAYLFMQPVMVADSSSATLENLHVVRGQDETVSGQLYDYFFVSTEGNNLVSGTVTSPDDTTYEMTLVYSDELEFRRESSEASDLTEFTTGDYVIKVKGSDGVEQTYTVALTGEMPTERPTFDEAKGWQTSDRRPLLSWNEPTLSEVNQVRFRIQETQQYYDQVFLTPGEDPMSYTPWEDLALGNAMLYAGFGVIQEGTVNGADFFSGFVSGRDSYLNVIPLPGDVDGDGWVSGSDLTIIISYWGQTGLGRSFGDLNGNGVVDGPDYAEVLSFWNPPSEPPSQATPEPATLGLLLLGGLVMLRRRK